MDDRQAFLNEILANPDDDTPRLIFADWLEEQGDPRGEFIRIQCEMEEVNHHEPLYYELQDRCHALLAAHGEDWASELKQDVKKTQFRRGFIETVTVLASRFLKEGAALYQSAPIQWLRLNRLKGRGGELAECEHLQHVTSLDLSSLKIPSDDLVPLLGSSNWNRLTGLCFNDLEVDNSVVQALGHAPFAKQLKSLSVRDIESSEISQVPLTGNFDNLESLAFGTSYGTPYFGGMSFAVPNLKKLEIGGETSFSEIQQLDWSQLIELKLQNVELTSSHVRHLHEQGAFQNLTTLALVSTHMDDGDADLIFRDDQLVQCRALSLESNYELSWAFLETMCEHAPLQSVEDLNLQNVRALNPRLFQSPVCENLKELDLRNTDLTIDLLDAMADANFRETLLRLDLDWGFESRDDAIGLHKLHYPSLTSLDVGYTYIGDDTFRKMVEANCFPALRRLVVNECSLTEKSLKLIAESEMFQNLRFLEFRNNKASNDTMYAVLDALPHLQMFNLYGTTGLRGRPKMREALGDRVKF